MRIMSVVGARPNFMKIAPFIRAINKHNLSAKTKIEHLLVHTGQHYDIRMSQKFFDDLNIPPADIHLGIGSGTHAEQVGHTMIALEKEIKKHKPDWLVIVGDVNAVCAGAITAKKEHINLAHIEAGLRSGDITMPEEVNRLVADRLADLLFTPDKISVENLRKEGVPEERIKFVGNIMIDTLENERNKAESLNPYDIIKNNILIQEQKTPEILPLNYIILTLHRPSNVDNKEVFSSIISFIKEEVSEKYPIIWPIHPRARKRLEEFGLWNEIVSHKNILLLYPLGYHELLRLNMDAKMILTDSGGLQEEATVLGVPCLTLRWNTERPVTLKKYGGASVLVGNNVERIREEFYKTLNEERKPTRPELWDGHTAERIVKIFSEL
jgi:UDP-N-acetylglucosamine 2-epimerase (non-hydrolysing)